jgi:putative spermidine/putrescine transport system substrate-binding protein
MNSYRPTRRKFLRHSSLGFVAAASGIFSTGSAGAAPTLIVADPGGEWQEAARAAFYAPFQAATGTAVRFTSRPSLPLPQPLSQLDAAELAHNVQWDVTELPDYLMYLGGKTGLLQPIDTSGMDTAGMLEGALTPYGVGIGARATIMAYSARKWPAGQGPKSWADFWDVARFPGRRAMSGIGYGPLEFALLADGVPADELYPLDIERALLKLSEIKPHVEVWWTSGAQQEQLMRDGAVDLIQGRNDRLEGGVAGGAPFHLEWNQGLYQWEGWAVPKGAPDAAEAAKFIAFAMRAKQQAIFAEHIAYGPANGGALALIPTEKQVTLPTYPPNLKQLTRTNAEWLAANLYALTVAWARWVAGCRWAGAAC